MNSDSKTHGDSIFVILRCIREEKDKELWRRCYTSIRYFYDMAKIIIIDDNSPYRTYVILRKLSK